ncbi:hypothetical protein MLD38_005678 [Melastoma candidum]|uniref:Uncharacterized protein n=1 Tax=Melastoma candidum TaxID=119954 RepID=A0ACB9RLP1_9MYRT|nr:hypothetical protein MLD38_005678 [Melastoma candidum]
MSATTTRRHTAAAPGHHHHRMASSSYSSAATTTFASSSAAFTSPSPTSLLHRSSSPTRVTLSPQPSQSIRFSLDRPVPVSPASNRRPPQVLRSLRPSRRIPRYSPNRLHARRSAMTNSLVRICGVEGGDLVKRALAALIRPSSHQQRRRAAFQPRPSRLSVMSKE